MGPAVVARASARGPRPRRATRRSEPTRWWEVDRRVPLSLASGEADSGWSGRLKPYSGIASRSYVRDEGRLLGSAVQAGLPNHPKRLGHNGLGRERWRKRHRQRCQVETKKVSVELSHASVEIRFDDVKTEGFPDSPDERRRHRLTAFAASGV